MEDKEMITLISEDGEEMTLELIEIIEIDDNKYALLAPEDEEDAYVYKMIEEDGNVQYLAVEDDEEFEMVLEEYNSMFDEEE